MLSRNIVVSSMPIKTVPLSSMDFSGNKEKPEIIQKKVSITALRITRLVLIILAFVAISICTAGIYNIFAVTNLFNRAQATQVALAVI